MAMLSARRTHASSPSARYAVVLLLMVALGGGLPLAGIAALRSALGLASGPIYTIADVQRLVRQDPTAWIGRTVLVRGWAVADHERVDPNTVDTLATLVDSQVRGWLPRLLVVRGRGDAVLAVLRRVPLVGRFAPRPQVLQRD